MSKEEDALSKLTIALFTLLFSEFLLQIVVLYKAMFHAFIYFHHYCYWESLCDNVTKVTEKLTFLQRWWAVLVFLTICGIGGWISAEYGVTPRCHSSPLDALKVCSSSSIYVLLYLNGVVRTRLERKSLTLARVHMVYVEAVLFRDWWKTSSFGKDGGHLFPYTGLPFLAYWGRCSRDFICRHMEIHFVSAL